MQTYALSGADLGSGGLHQLKQAPIASSVVAQPIQIHAAAMVAQIDNVGLEFLEKMMQDVQSEPEAPCRAREYDDDLVGAGRISGQERFEGSGQGAGYRVTDGGETRQDAASPELPACRPQGGGAPAGAIEPVHGMIGLVQRAPFDEVHRSLEKLILGRGTDCAPFHRRVHQKVFLKLGSGPG